MRNLRNVLAALAFVFAVGAAFASAMAVQTQSREKVAMDQGPIIPNTCVQLSVTVSVCDRVGPRFCDIPDTGGQFWRYYELPGCLLPYKKL